MDEGRKHDIADINGKLKSTRDPVMRKVLTKAKDAIRTEQQSSYKKDIRQTIIRERLKGNTGNVQDISEDVVKHPDRTQSMTYYFSFPKGFWSK